MPLGTSSALAVPLPANQPTLILSQAFGVGGAGSAGPASGLVVASGGMSICKFSGLRIKERKVPEALMDSYMQVRERAEPLTQTPPSPIPSILRFT